MKLALNEVGGMALKAARGAGIPLGQAEDLSRIAIHLAGCNQSVTPVTRALQEPLDPVEIQWSHDAIVIKNGPAALIGPIVRDAFEMGVAHARLANPDHVAFVAATLAQSGVALTCNGKTLTRSNDAVPPVICQAVKIPADDWQIWADLAAKTYVPQTAESRLAGAGAGLNDND